MSTRLTSYLFIILAVSLAGIYGVVWSANVVDSPQIVNRDFTIFATAVGVVDEHGYTEIYDIERQREAQQALVGTTITLGGGLLPFNHPPFLIPILRAVIGPDFHASFILWTLINVGLVGLCLWLSTSIMSQAGWPINSHWPVWIALILLFPLHTNLLQGQDILVVLLGLLIFIRAIQSNNALLAGAGLALTAISPHLALIFGIPWFFSRPKKFYSFVLFGGLLALISVALIGFGGVQDYLTMLSETAGAEGDTFGVNKIQMYSISSLALRLWPAMPQSVLSAFTWGGYILGIGWLSWLHYQHRSSESNRLMVTLAAITFAAGLLFAPHLHSHSLLPLWAVLLIWGINRVTSTGQSALVTGNWLLAASLLMALTFVTSINIGWVFVFIVMFAALILTRLQLND